MTEPAQDDDPATQADGQAQGAPGPSLLALLQALFADAKILVEAETGYYRALVAFAIGRAKVIAILVVMAMFFMFFTLMAGVMGLLLALAPLIGAWLATGLVVVVLTVLGVGCGLVAWWRVRRMIRLLTGTNTARNGS